MSLDKAVKALLEILKQPLKYAIGVGVVAAIALFSPDSVIDRMGLLKYRDEGKPYLGIALLLCFAIAIANAIGFATGEYRHYSLLRAGKKRLHRLTTQEKQVLRRYIEGQTQSIYLDVNSGVVNALVNESVIYRASNFSNPQFGRMAFAYNIQPWAWDYLNEHRDILGE
jgi:hypothetical protein